MQMFWAHSSYLINAFSLCQHSPPSHYPKFLSKKWPSVGLWLLPFIVINPCLPKHTHTHTQHTHIYTPLYDLQNAFFIIISFEFHNHGDSGDLNSMQQVGGQVLFTFSSLSNLGSWNYSPSLTYKRVSKLAFLKVLRYFLWVIRAAKAKIKPKIVPELASWI